MSDAVLCRSTQWAKEIVALTGEGTFDPNATDRTRPYANTGMVRDLVSDVGAFVSRPRDVWNTAPRPPASSLAQLEGSSLLSRGVSAAECDRSWLWPPLATGRTLMGEE
ncbi:hypothetical protein MRX96_001691 [Rhipicephalus microplus]